MNKKKIILILLIMLLAVLAVLAIHIFVIDRNPLENVKGEAVTVYDTGRDITTVYFNMEKIGQVDGKAYVDTNLNNTYCYIHPDMDLNNSTNNRGVYYIEENKLVEVGKDMLFLVGATHSSHTLMKDRDGILYRYDGVEFEKLCDKGVKYAAISGDGQYFSYTINGNSYYGKNAENVTEVENAVITHISENGEYIYGLRNLKIAYNDNLFRYYDYLMSRINIGSFEENAQLFIIESNGNITDIRDDVLGITAINVNGAEILIRTVEGTYALVNGKDLYKVSNQHILEVYGLESDIEWYGIYGDFETFSELVAYEGNIGSYERDGKIHYVSKGEETKVTMFTEDYKTEVLAENCNSIAAIINGGKDIYYRAEDGLYMVKAEIGSVSEKICESYNKYIFLEDRLIYCIDSTIDNIDTYDEETYAKAFYYNTDGELEEIDRVYLDYLGAIAYKDGCLIFTEGSAFYLTENSYKRKTSIYGINGMFTDSSNENVYVYDDNKVYIVVDFKKIELPGSYENIEPAIK